MVEVRARQGMPQQRDQQAQQRKKPAKAGTCVVTHPVPHEKAPCRKLRRGLPPRSVRLEEFAGPVPGDEGAGEERPQPHRPEHPLRLAQHAVDQAGNGQDHQGADDVAANGLHIALAIGDRRFHRAGVDHPGEGRQRSRGSDGTGDAQVAERGDRAELGDALLHCFHGVSSLLGFTKK